MLSIEIEYCKPCGLGSLALSLTERLINEMDGEISSLRLIPSSGGRFEVTVNGRLLFSKSQSKKRAEVDEIMTLIKESRSVA